MQEEFKVDTELKPLKKGETFQNEFAMMAELLGGLQGVEDLFISYQNKILVANMQLPLGKEGEEDRMLNRVKYEFYNKLRSAIHSFKTNKTSKR